MFGDVTMKATDDIDWLHIMPVVHSSNQCPEQLLQFLRLVVQGGGS